ncbi:unnamed protein product, partial [Owenia fusiformis]
FSILGHRSSILDTINQNSVSYADIPQNLDLTNGDPLGFPNGIDPYNALGLYVEEPGKTYESTEARLFRDFKRVDTMRYVRPINMNSSGGTLIHVSLSILKINDMIDQDEKLTTTVHLQVKWDDYRLRWNKTKYGDLDVINLPARMLWTPEIEIVDGYRFTHIDISQYKARVSSNGTVSISRVMYLDTSCALDVTLYPYDDQTCNITIGSRNWNAKELIYVNDGMSVEYFELSMLWALVGTWSKSHIIRNEAEIHGYSYVVFTLYLERQSLFYSVHLIWPTILIAILTCLVFFIPGDSGETMQLAVSLLLTFTVYLLYAANKMPENSRSVPLFGVILMCLLMTSALSIMLCVILLIWHHLGDHKKKMPCCIEGLIFDGVRYLVCTNLPTEKIPRVKRLPRTTGCPSDPALLYFRNVPSSSKPNSNNQNAGLHDMQGDINMNEIPTNHDSGPSLKLNESTKVTSTPRIIDVNNEIDDAVDGVSSNRTYKNAAKICGRFIGGCYLLLIIFGTVLATVIIRNLPTACYKNKVECNFAPDNRMNSLQSFGEQLLKGLNPT